MKALIVDDELHSREILSMLIKRECPQIKDVKMADSVNSALELISTVAPDILFLDVQMPEEDGFHLLREIDTTTISIIFVTAHDEYALQAIQCSPTAYLLKPIIVEELKEAVEKAITQLHLRPNNQDEYQEAIKHLSQTLNSKKQLDRICLTHSSKLQIVKLKDIVLLSSEGNYTYFHLTNGSTILTSKTLKTYEEALGDQFLRVHHSHLVNLIHIKEFIFDSNVIELSNGKRATVSRRKVNEIVKRLKLIS